MSSIVLKGSTSGDVTVQAPAVATGTVTMPSASGTLLTTTGDGSSLTGVGKFSSYAIIADQKSQNTDGGTFTAGGWRTRDLNTEITDPDGIVSISSNQFTLGAGSYLIRWVAQVFDVDRHHTRLYDVTGSTAIVQSLSSFGQTSGGQQDHSEGIARVSHGSSTTYRIEHYGTVTASTLGFGVAGNITTEQYLLVEIYKEA